MEPILKDVKSDADYPRFETIYTKLYDTVTSSSKKRETFFDYAGLGDFQVKGEGNTVTFTDPIAGAEMFLEHVRFSNGYKVTQEMLDHDQYGEIRKLEADLRVALADFLEVRGHLLLNNAFGTTDSTAFKSTDFRGEALISTSHTNLDGSTAQSNRPSTDADLDWTSLGNAIIQFSLWKDNRARVARSEPQTLIIHPNDQLTAMELMQSTQKPGTANNEINAIRGAISELIVSPYITDTDAWYVKAAKTDTIWLWDVQPRFGAMEDWELEVIKRKVVTGFSHGHLRWLGYYGSNGSG